MSFSNNLIDLISSHDRPHQKNLSNNGSWSEKTSVLITYADTIQSINTETPLSSLHSFSTSQFESFIDTIHILPFFPSSSDDGFAVKDYYSIDKNFGSWDDIVKITKNFKLMADVVINHGSSSGTWFKNFINGRISES